ncbi:MAG: 16S rRNA (cytosine(1402)-N(4))-methyltransferase RsmH [Candidatus Goldbacteria bacterium]|nr:16S rRNA (cytosine(1402)-N(4))-methyltransferase RsmH [Candidatus Goldiibacteriota bacterium]
MNYPHQPVLLNQTIEFLNIKNKDGVWVDATLGLGGHSEEILKRITPGSLLIGIDCDEESIEIARKRLKHYKNFIPVHSNFKDLDIILAENKVNEIDGIIFDLGFSSYQIEKSGRGFSFLVNEKLDMRLDKRQDLSAYYIINHYSKDELDKIIKEYGEDKNHRRLAELIVKNRPIRTTKELAEIAIRVNKKEKRIHPATRLFQAIRIEVNNELDVLEIGLRKALRYLKSGARIAVISFHSLEDRIVKNFFQKESKDCICENKKMICNCNHKKVLKILTKKPVMADKDMIKTNPRARSAHLRVAEKI